jgi:hypothetical protein
VDALAMAPYFTLNLSGESDPTADMVARWPAQTLSDHQEKVALPESEVWGREHLSLARGLRCASDCVRGRPARRWGSQRHADGPSDTGQPSRPDGYLVRTVPGRVEGSGRRGPGAASVSWMARYRSDMAEYSCTGWDAGTTARPSWIALSQTLWKSIPART